MLKELHRVLKRIIGKDSRPVVVFSSMWPFLKHLKRSDMKAIDDILEILIDAVGSSSLLMPAFSSGYENGVCNLDTANSSTGILSERFREKASHVRTLSAFFSFSVRGNAALELAYLKPKDAWGDASVYHWMEQANARFLMLGTHSTHCSYLHRLEWLVKNSINYRFDKDFSGTLIRNNEIFNMKETLFVRSIEPLAENNFTILEEYLNKAGMQKEIIGDIEIATYDTCLVKNHILPIFLTNPLVALANKKSFYRD